MTRQAVLAVIAALALSACGAAPDPTEILEASDLDAYWGVEATSGNESYIAPLARVRLSNKSARDLTFVRAMATFRLAGSEDAWGSDFKFVTSGGKPLRAGETIALEFKSEARYHSPVAPQEMFGHEQFKDARVEIYVRVASSPWKELTKGPVARRIGSRTAQDSTAPTPVAVPSHH